VARKKALFVPLVMLVMESSLMEKELKSTTACFVSDEKQ